MSNQEEVTKPSSCNVSMSTLKGLHRKAKSGLPLKQWCLVNGETLLEQFLEKFEVMTVSRKATKLMGQ